MTSLLRDTKLDAEQRDYSETIRASGEALLTIINDILDLSKVEAGKMELFLETFDIAPMIQDVSMTVDALMQKNSNTLQVETI